MNTERNSLTNIFLATGLVLIGYLLLKFEVFGPMAHFWLLITGLLACKLTYGKTFILFKKPKFKDVGLVLICLVLALVWAFGYVFIAHGLGATTTDNPVTNSPDMWTFLELIPALLGEELLVLVPFSLIATHLAKNGKGNQGTLVLLVLASSLIFGALHLPVYQWNWAQAVIAVGLVRTFFTYAYLKSKNILPAFATHLLYDSLLILFSMV
ncbi:MAG: type II CAAX prenyl endopeptidase Rce1 family protein [Enterococcus sp.]